MTEQILNFEDIETYEDLLNALQKASKEQLKQRVQTVKSHSVDEHVYELQQGIAFATVDELQLRYARSSVDNRRHGEELVIFTDGNSHGEGGAIAYDLNSEDIEWGEKISEMGKPIYPENHDESADWTGPAQKLADKQGLPEGRGTLGAILKKRLKDYTDNK